MEYLNSRQVAQRVRDLIHFETQGAIKHLDLTVAEIHEPAHRGALDFGGSEFESAEYTKIQPVLKNEDDDYGWWELGPGTYFFELNEKLALDDGERAELSPHPRLLKTGHGHPTIYLTPNDNETIVIPVTIGEHGLNLKENCRVSQLYIGKL